MLKKKLENKIEIEMDDMEELFALTMTNLIQLKTKFDYITYMEYLKNDVLNKNSQ